ncbi:MAG: ATP-binding protein [Chloroflexi bacterium]|nr:ATP-binding protein [Chloroflexota bacterium]MBU1748813.1 ATP-binding protein [Chloroflexota bacterium]
MSVTTGNLEPTLRPYLRVPRSVAETSLSPGSLYDLALKAIYFAGELSGQAVAETLKLPYTNVVEKLLSFLVKEELVSITGSSGFSERGYNHVVTKKGSAKVQEVLARSQYVGAAPVSLDAYKAVMSAQSIGELVITQPELRQAFRHLVVSDVMLRRIGPAANSARSIFLYGPPGNGKTVIAETLSRLLKGDIYIPYAVEVDGQVIQVFDGLNHTPVAEGIPTTDTPFTTDDVRLDARWVLCRRPFIVVGGELTLESLDLIFDPITKIYEAPYQMKANGGMFLIDDFGRQQVHPRDLLNRWIVPLEKRVDFLTLQTGKKIEIPFDILIVFSTNLDPADLVDDAFLRRIRHKIEVPNPTWDEFREIFGRVAAARGIPYDDETLKYLVLEHYIKVKREPRSVHPRDLIDQVLDLAKYLETEPRLSKELLDGAVEAYFVKF